MLKGAATILTVAGVPIRVHWTFLILLAWVVISGSMRSGNLGAGLALAGFVVAVFVCVVLHELGHVFAARAFGVRTRDITLLPIGGVASLERMPEKPSQELIVALAGPAVNVAIAAALLPWLLSSGAMSSLQNVDDPARYPNQFLASLAAVNIWLVVFNMIPAFPMDGGRVLRALLAMVVDRVTATRAAATLGQIVAAGFALFGLLAGAPLLLLIALFVFLGAGAEASDAQTRASLAGLRVADAMMRRFRILAASDTLRTASEELLAGSQTEFPVTESGADAAPLVGVLTRMDLVKALAGRGLDTPVAEAMRPVCPPVAPGDDIERAVESIRSSGCPIVPVVEQGRLVGIVTPENVGELVMLRSARA